MSENPDIAQKTAAFGCLGFLALMGIFFLKACHDDDARQQVPFDKSSAIAIDAYDLDAAFRDNEVAAKSKYGHASLRVTGTVSEIRGGSPVAVSLSGSGALNVDALVPDEKSVIPLHVGDRVELLCVGARLSLSTTVIDACNSVKVVM